mmetsp:Transcript_66930/g.172344  ORF Transcript_66930/g.172344 Transcript_66930/m.172344 type:complete len:200 (-) Transcript_66930:698-1297(-)
MELPIHCLRRAVDSPAAKRSSEGRCAFSQQHSSFALWSYTAVCTPPCLVHVRRVRSAWPHMRDLKGLSRIRTAPNWAREWLSISSELCWTAIWRFACRMVCANSMASLMMAISDLLSNFSSGASFSPSFSTACSAFTTISFQPFSIRQTRFKTSSFAPFRLRTCLTPNLLTSTCSALFTWPWAKAVRACASSCRLLTMR